VGPVAPDIASETCGEEACRGTVADGRWCLAHLPDDELESVLARMKAAGTLNAQRVVISDELLGRLLDGFGEADEQRRRVVADVEFDGATFDGALSDFTDIVFAGRARFSDAVFRGQVSFSGSVFKRSPIFEGARFENDAHFGRQGPLGKYAPGDEPVVHTVFERRGQFGNATFKGSAVFRDASFGLAALFDGAIFEAGVDFEGARFANVVSLAGADLRRKSSAKAGMEEKIAFAQADLSELHCDGAEFSATFSLREAKLAGGVSFRRAVFRGDADFAGQTFRDRADFSDADFDRDANFGSSEFHVFPSFNRATFTGDAAFGYSKVSEDGSVMSFDGATFSRDVSLEGVALAYGVSFAGVAFDGHLDLVNATLGGTSSFDNATFERTQAFVRVSADWVTFNRSVFKQAVRMEIAADSLTFHGTQFIAGVNLGVRWAEIVFAETEFGRASLIVGLPRAFVNEGELAARLEDDPVRTDRPRITSVQQTDVGKLTFARVDLRACRFAGSVNLDTLRLEAEAEFGEPPSGRRWARRGVIAEEHEWRKEKYGQEAGWYPEACQPRTDAARLALDLPRPELDAGPVAPIYRSLRKGREDTKDEPGAADFYYGEMEMRRFDKTKPQAERLILSLYWLVSGYGLRASRALLSLLVTILVFAALLYAWGFPSQRSFLDAVTFSAESTTSLFRAPDRPLTLAGEWLQIGLRLLGPLFFGLALLSLRGRVKR
jgi:uncharacterized protein YjbI with pentapeptide repeats